MSVVKRSDVELSVIGISVVKLWAMEESSVVKLFAVLWLLVWVWMVVLVCVVSG